MNKNVYILYDSALESTESLDKFKKIMILAGFDESLLNVISLDEYKTHLESNSFYNFVIAINQTYKEINQTYSDKLNIPIFDFFSKEFTDNSNKLVLFGLLFAVKSIYESAYKKFSWSVVQKFHTEYVAMLERTEDDIDENESSNYLNDTPPETKENQEVVNVLTIEEEKVTETIEDEPSTVIAQDATVDDDEVSFLTYEELFDFYNKSKDFIHLFESLKSQINSIENKINE